MNNEGKSGEWIYDPEIGPRCSLCGKVTEDRQDELEILEEDVVVDNEIIANKGTKCWALKLPNYCSRCGARMKERIE